MKYPKKILIIKNRAFGDSVIGLGAVQYIKTIFPDAKIVYGVPSWVAPLYQNVISVADAYVPFKLNKFLDWIKMARAIRKEKFDLIIELQQGGRTAIFFKLFFKKKYFYHNHNLREGTFVIDQGVRKPIIQRDLDGCFSVAKKLFGFSKIPYYLDYQPRLENPSSRGFKIDRIILGIVATRQTKMWSLEKFKDLVEEFEDIEFIVPLSSSQQDQKLEEELHRLGMKVRIVKKGLADLPMELSGAKCYVGNDTGLKHLCVALGVPTFTFFGPEEPSEWHPYDLDCHKYFFIPGLECRTRKSHYCGLAECDSMICMNEISFKAVVADIRKYLFR